MPLVKRKTNAERAPTYSKALALEAALPRVIEEQLSITELAKLASVHTSTANKFLARKAEDFALSNKVKFLNFDPRHAAAFNKAAERQMEWIEELNEKPRHRWTDADFKLEKHAMAILKSLSPFLEIAARALATAPALREKPDGEDGENPQDAAPDPPATLGDGL